METLKSLCLGTILILAGNANAQLTLNITIGPPPQWGPVGITGARYYYLPAIETYYDIQTTMFIYSSGGTWIKRYNLPARYRNYDLYYGYKVVIPDYHGDTPYTNFTEYKVKYNRGYRGIPQKTIGEKPGRGNSRSSSKYVKHQHHDGGKDKKP